MTVAIISEYNPFHTGHKYQIDEVRKAFGEGTDIIAVMSGNFTQRGELAFADKYARAEWATLSGVNLVLELPFPFSMASAEIFAKAAIKIIDSLGIVDFISFGSENGDLDFLIKTAENMQKPEYKKALEELSLDNDKKNLGYPALSELAYKKAFRESPTCDILLPNNILAIEYIKALKELCSSIKLHTVRREGASYNEEKISDKAFQSAKSIRSAIKEQFADCIDFIPEPARTSFIEKLKNDEFPTEQDKLSSAVISHFRLNNRDDENEIFDLGGGLYFRLKNASIEANDISSLISLAETKKFTNARIRRALWYSFFGVTSSDVKELPQFSQVLAFDQKGRALLKSIKAKGSLPLITKPSSFSHLNDTAKKQKLALDRADSVFQLAKPKSVSGASALRAKPFVKE